MLAAEMRERIDVERKILGDGAYTDSHAEGDATLNANDAFTIQFEQRQQPSHDPEEEETILARAWEDDEDDDILARPILVGYAFGPKKMSTMGVVMAEASRTALSTLATTVLVEGADEDELASDNDDDNTNDHDDNHCDQHKPSYSASSAYDAHGIDRHSSNSEGQHQPYHSQPLPAPDLTLQKVPGPPKEAPTSSARAIINDREIHKASKDNDDTGCCSTLSSSPRRSKPMDAANGNENIMLSLDSYSGGLKNIVRYLHSSCSSVDTNSTNTTMLTTGTSAFTPSSCGNKFGAASTHSGKGSTTGGNSHQRLLRVSFVPLDPDLPLEGQHGAKVDVILHKLTEDILCLSKFSPLYPDLVTCLGVLAGDNLKTFLKDLCPPLPQDAQEAILRVHRLMRYQRKNPDCLLADDPRSVLTLMSRSAIAHALADCLVGVTSASGIPVSSPKFVVWDHHRNQVTKDANAEMSTMERDVTLTSTEVIAQRLDRANMSYPLIAKPLQAAGTKLSHHMTVLLNASSLEHIDTSSCLLQEYANHDAVLYKVYVLGNNVRVYQRPSLPNLPPLDTFADEGKTTESRHSPSYVDFDSQRPYPRLSAFGVKEGKYSAKGTPPPAFLSSLAKPTATHPKIAVTADEVQPIVDTLKNAFGLELFGFDILIASSNAPTPVDGDACGNTSRKRMYVVDVNYFPSYKEVSDFPSLLAQYLTQRAVDRRRRQAQS